MSRDVRSSFFCKNMWIRWLVLCRARETIAELPSSSAHRSRLQVPVLRVGCLPALELCQQNPRSAGVFTNDQLKEEQEFVWILLPGVGKVWGGSRNTVPAHGGSRAWGGTCGLGSASAAVDPWGVLVGWFAQFSGPPWPQAGGRGCANPPAGAL